MTFIVPPEYRGLSLPGQVPGREAREIMRFASQPAPKMTIERMMSHDDRPRFTVDSVVKGLGFDQPTEASWRKFLEGAFSSPDEVSIRKALYAKFQEERVPSELRTAIFQRSMGYLRTTRMTKALLIKGEARGGAYYRRVPKGKGKFTYYYDPEKYHAEEGAHVAGDHAQKAHMTKRVGALLDKAGLDGCGVEEMKGLARRYGADKVAAHLRESTAKGHVVFKAGRFYKKPAEDGAEEKPEPKKFTVKRKKESGK